MSENATATITGIYRYPVKGLSPEKLPRVALGIGQTFPADRRYAIENGPSGFDPAAPKWMSKAHFLMLMRDEWLAGLHTHFDDASNVLTIRRDGSIAAQGDLETAQGRGAIEAVSGREFRRTDQGTAKNPSRPRTTVFPTWQRKWCRSSTSAASPPSQISSASRCIRCAFAPIFTWRAGRPGTNSICSAKPSPSAIRRLKVVKRILRCAAVNVDPETAARDLSIPNTLLRTYGNADCGVYAEVIAGGSIAIGDAINSLDQPALL